MKFDVYIQVLENGKRAPKYTLDSDLNGEVSIIDLFKFTKNSLIVITDQTLKEEQARGFDKDPILLVDGRRNRDVRTVHPLGQLELVARQQFGDVLLEAYNGLLKRSKERTGRYKDSHYVFFNGVLVATDLRELQAWLRSNPDFKEGNIIRIANIQPYARKLELWGVTAQRSKTRLEDKGRRKGEKTGKIIKVPNGAYMLTARSIKSKYKQNAGIRFTFLPASSLGLSGTFKTKGRNKNSVGRPYLHPSLVITVQERGIF